jgi:predicted transcriptional regulator with HTH domain
VRACAYYDCAATGCARLYGCPLAVQVRQDPANGDGQLDGVSVRANGLKANENDVSASIKNSRVSGFGHRDQSR